MARKSSRIIAAKPVQKRDLPVRSTRNMASLAIQATPSPTPSARTLPRPKLRFNEDGFKMLQRIVASDNTQHRPSKATERVFGLQEVPTFYPTEEQFCYPDVYISSIRKHAEHYGMCKIVPPASFQPEFALNLKVTGVTGDTQPLRASASRRRCRS